MFNPNSRTFNYNSQGFNSNYGGFNSNSDSLAQTQEVGVDIYATYGRGRLYEVTLSEFTRSDLYDVVRCPEHKTDFFF